jgi:hypothetical protein
MIVDFLQIIGDEPQIPGFSQRLDLRERIGRAAYVARQVARDSNVAVILVSSTSRGNYDAAGELAANAKLDVDAYGRSFISRPDVLIGQGKESGEIEYAADTVSSLIKGPEVTTVDGKERVVILATAKNRYRGTGWTPLRFNGTSFKAWDNSRQEVLEALKKQGAPTGQETKSKPGKTKEPPPSVTTTRPKRDASYYFDDGDENAGNER